MIIEFVKQYISDNPNMSSVSLSRLYKLYNVSGVHIDAFKYIISEYFTVSFFTLFMRHPVTNYRTLNKRIQIRKGIRIDKDAIVSFINSIIDTLSKGIRSLCFRKIYSV
jgi:hypothetical protein